ncbi:SGNH/GDSL hydrolase family protein [Cytobacillus oceanisediminis]|uniref:SGNH/GDSL hydrolase family protein n=1 Tax=Niallia alba TaxID=2729105 RepID=A0A7Y0K9F5_9BACI|nr:MULTISPECIES: SGNH/GDSL hydrolase family protein [Bacillaceae]MBQ6446104.1 SGNH/GDSL hydrolase family protein [Bacillus sp. (in: firmicutes)]MDU1846231.1 GDSL-type esterase/lipase family protein [Niallia nealsonii]MBZ9534240.1 SGNH/GDSL hydrolase family protein [Cytobacillus oceanisediminis]MED3792302.1 GDSL-type esterase/lipase family protein [Niallia alba]NMO78146.1 SGNH/GDSL hydrolase family protein [Niallia alba]
MKKGLKYIIYSLIFIVIISMFYLLIDSKQPERNVYKKIADGKQVNYLIVGDSIGRSSGASNNHRKWFQLVERSLTKKYGGSFKRHLVVQSGATAFEGLYKLKNSLSKDVDLVFIVFGENDRKYMDDKQFYFFYQSLLEEIVIRHPHAELVTITESSLDNEDFVHIIKQLSKEFYATNIDMRIPFRNSGLSTERLTNDLVHPNDYGYYLYAQAVVDTMNKAIREKKTVLTSTIPVKEVSSLEMNTLHPFHSIDPSFKNEAGFYTSNKIGADIEYHFSGSFLGVNVIRSEKGGMIDVFVDDNYVTTISTWWPFKKERSLYVTSGLTDRNHTVTFQLSANKSRYNITDQQLVQISSIITN